MKLTMEEFERVEQAAPLVLFNQGIKAEMTREKYTRTLRQVLCGMLEDILEGDLEGRAEQLVQHGREDPAWVRDLLLSLSRKLLERTRLAPDNPEYLRPVSFGGYFKPVKKLLDMNDVVIPWKRIYATFPEETGLPSSSRGWTRAEVQKMLRFCRGPLERAIILVAASSGIRIGGFEELEWRDLVPVYRMPDGTLEMGDAADGREMDGAGNPACAKLQIYRGSGESYPAFITPEAYAALDDYRAECADRIGRKLLPGDPLFIGSGCLPRRLSVVMIKKHILDVLTRSGLRGRPGPDGSRSSKTRRHDVPMTNGFRRFWNKTCKEASSRESPLSSLIKKEYMMGHSGLVKLDRNYFKTHTLELAEEYLQVVPALTLDDAARLRMENDLQAQRIASLEDEKGAEIADLRLMVEQLAKRIGPDVK